MSTELAWLKERMDAAVAGLRGVTVKRMFGCDAYFRDAKIFAMVWKEGRLAVKLPDAASHDTLAAVKGVHPWSPGGKMVMTSWLLVPSAWNEDEESLRPWVERAFDQVSAPAKKVAAKKKVSAPAKKVSAKKKVAARTKTAAKTKVTAKKKRALP